MGNLLAFRQLFGGCFPVRPDLPILLLSHKVWLSERDAASVHLFFLPILLWQLGHPFPISKRQQRGRSNQKQGHH
jgi:hypothetical protein